MDIFQAIEKRHSYRKGFTGASVPREDLQKIVTAGMRAPSGCNAQTTSFVIVDDEALIAKIAAILNDKPVVAQARAIIICVVRTEDVFHGMSFGAEDCAAAVENILLATTALGYASVWTDGALRRENRAERIGELLGVPPELQVRVMLPIGVPEEAVRQPAKKPFEERAWFNRFAG